jgi:zinc transporter, ZIP family
MVLLFSVMPFVSTLLGGVVSLRLRHRLHPIMAFAAGVLVATALGDLLPEASDLVDSFGGMDLAGPCAVVGFLAFSALEAFVHRQAWEHQHEPSTDPDMPHEHGAVFGLVGPIGLILHSVLDGLAIGLGFRSSPELGLIVGVAVLVHDFADGMNVVTLALYGGARRGATFVLLGLDALAPVVGAIIGSVVPMTPAVLGVLISGFAGVFIAIGAGHLLPEAQHQRPGAAPRLVVLAATGAVLVVGLRRLIG